MPAPLHLAIDHASPLPLHAQVEDLLRRLIQQTPYATGGLLPEEVELAKRLAVSRGTVRTAIGRLVSEGLIERRRGVGTRVCLAPQHSGLGAWQSFRAEMAAKGITVEDFTCDFSQQPADEDCARALAVAEGLHLWRLERLRGWEGVPTVLMTSWFHPRLALNGSEDLAQGLYRALETHCGVVAMHSEEQITAALPTRALARRIGVTTSTPLLVRRRSVRDAGGRIIEWAINHYVSDRCVYTLEMERRT